MFQQMPALILGMLSAAAVITTTFWNQWAISSPNSSGILGPIWAFKSLFGECMQYQTGQYQCQELASQFLIPGYKIALRALMITSIFTSTLPCVGILLGMQCTKIFEDSPNLKRKIILWSGLSYFLSAVLTFTAMVWYTVEIYNDFFSTLDNFIQWEIGGCIYLGFISSILSLLAFLACVCVPGPRQESKSYSYAYEPAVVNGLEKSAPKTQPFKNEKTSQSHRFTDYV